MYEITPPCYAINICILYQLYFKWNGFIKDELIGYTHANSHHATTFGWRNIAFQIWWLPCNPQRGEWPKTFFGRCMMWIILTAFQAGIILTLALSNSLQTLTNVTRVFVMELHIRSIAELYITVNTCKTFLCIIRTTIPLLQHIICIFCL